MQKLVYINIMKQLFIEALDDLIHTTFHIKISVAI